MEIRTISIAALSIAFLVYSPAQAAEITDVPGGNLIPGQFFPLPNGGDIPGGDLIPGQYWPFATPVNIPTQASKPSLPTLPPIINNFRPTTDQGFDLPPTVASNDLGTLSPASGGDKVDAETACLAKINAYLAALSYSRDPSLSPVCDVMDGAELL